MRSLEGLIVLNVTSRYLVFSTDCTKPEESWGIYILKICGQRLVERMKESTTFMQICPTFMDAAVLDTIIRKSRWKGSWIPSEPILRAIPIK